MVEKTSNAELRFTVHTVSHIQVFNGWENLKGRTLSWEVNITLVLKYVGEQDRKWILSGLAWRTAAGSFADGVEQKGSA